MFHQDQVEMSLLSRARSSDVTDVRSIILRSGWKRLSNVFIIGENHIRHELEVKSTFWVPILTLMVFPLFTGEKVRVFSCCSRTSDEEGCSHGPHVFSESDPEKLHARHSFSFLPPADRSNTENLDVAALDCEMIYTTGGLKVARVSVINGLGKEVFDHLVRMDEGIQIM
jgi:hypothetical protein